MAAPSMEPKYVILSTIFHIVVLCILVLSFESSSTMVVFENTNQHDVISAVVLGDTEKSKILPKESPQPKPQPVKQEDPTPPKPKPVKAEQAPAIEKDVIALNKPDDKKKLIKEKAEEKIKKLDIFGKDLLADIKKQNNKQKQIKQKELQAQFQKVLQEQAEKTMRQQLLDENIKLQSTQAHLSQGVVDKYTALIVQAISEHWIIPTGVNKKLKCELLIRLAPGGMVMDAQVSKSSGDPSLDSSARAAVLKASPLPVPSKTEEFEGFRQFKLVVTPKNVIENG